jgi:hypothetical protein
VPSAGEIDAAAIVELSHAVDTDHEGELIVGAVVLSGGAALDDLADRRRADVDKVLTDRRGGRSKIAVSGRLALAEHDGSLHGIFPSGFRLCVYNAHISET